MKGRLGGPINKDYTWVKGNKHQNVFHLTWKREGPLFLETHECCSQGGEGNSPARTMELRRVSFFLHASLYLSLADKSVDRPCVSLATSTAIPNFLAAATTLAAIHGSVAAFSAAFGNGPLQSPFMATGP